LRRKTRSSRSTSSASIRPLPGTGGGTVSPARRDPKRAEVVCTRRERQDVHDDQGRRAAVQGGGADKPTVLVLIDRNELEDQMLRNLAALGLNKRPARKQHRGAEQAAEGRLPRHRRLDDPQDSVTCPRISTRGEQSFVDSSRRRCRGSRPSAACSAPRCCVACRTLFRPRAARLRSIWSSSSFAGRSEPARSACPPPRLEQQLGRP